MSAETFPETFADLVRPPASERRDRRVPSPEASTFAGGGAPSALELPFEQAPQEPEQTAWFGRPDGSLPGPREPRGSMARQWHAATRRPPTPVDGAPAAYRSTAMDEPEQQPSAARTPGRRELLEVRPTVLDLAALASDDRIHDQQPDDGRRRQHQLGQDHQILHDHQLHDLRPQDSRPEDRHPVDRQPVDHQPVDHQPYDHQPNDHQPYDQQPYDQQPIDHQPYDQQPYDHQPNDHQPYDHQPYDHQPIDHQPYDQLLDRPEPVAEIPDQLRHEHHAPAAPAAEPVRTRAAYDRSDYLIPVEEEDVDYLADVYPPEYGLSVPETWDHDPAGASGRWNPLRRRQPDQDGPPRRRYGALAGGLLATLALVAVVAGALHAADAPDPTTVVAGPVSHPNARPPAGVPTLTPTIPVGSAMIPSRVARPVVQPVVAPARSGRTRTVSVYWMESFSGGAARLVREIRPVPDRGDALTSAVSALLSSRPLDPGYRSPWHATTSLIAHSGADGITIDLGQDAFSPDLSPDQAAVAIQSLVWTATEATATGGPVIVLVDGRAGYLAWGAVRLGDPMVRQLYARASVSIDTPLESAVLAPGLVRLTGIGAPAGRHFAYMVRRAGVPAASGVFTATTSPSPGWWSFDIGVILRPGRYTATVSVTGAGARAGRWADNRTFVVS